jgi:hypothetical protein
LKKKETRLVDGVRFPATWSDARCLLWLYLFSPQLTKDPLWRPDVEDRPESYSIDLHPEYYGYEPQLVLPWSGQGRFHYTRILTDMFMPKAFEWHDWSNRIVQTSCDNNLVAITGCGTSGKSTGLGLDSFWWWACNPLETAVILISTTIDSSKKRIWKETSRFYRAFDRAVGGYRDATIGSSPRPYISPYMPRESYEQGPPKRDQAHGVYVVAFQKKSDIDEEMEYIKGFHPRRMMVVVDEMDSLREHGKALHKVFNENLASGTIEAKFVVLGNDPSLFNELGDIMQRTPGKPLTEADTEWTSIHGFACLRLDAWDSPNIRDNNKWTGLIRQEDINRITANGAKMNTPAVYVQLKGLHPPEGTENTVLSEAMITRFHCRDGVTWKGYYERCALIDPAHGGDNCTIREMDYGLDTDNKMKILFGPQEYIEIDATEVDKPVEYQLSDGARAFCTARNIPPENVIGDSTGTTGGCMAVLRREWSMRVNECEFGGRASTRIVRMDKETPKTARDEYDRRVTELWFTFREYVEADMVRGLDNKTASQFCSRTFEIVARKTKIEKKEEMKERGLSSPDDADCSVTGTDLLTRRGILPVIEGVAKSAAADTMVAVARDEPDVNPEYIEEFEGAEEIYDY